MANKNQLPKAPPPFQTGGSGQPWFGQAPGNLSSIPGATPITQTQNTEGFMDKYSKQLLISIAGIIAIVLACFFIWPFIQALTDQAQRFHRHITMLFNTAPDMFNNSHSFGAAIQLIAIAVFIGWVLNKIINRR